MTTNLIARLVSSLVQAADAEDHERAVRAIAELVAADPTALVAIFNQLPNEPPELRSDVVKQLAGIAPKMAELLEQEMTAERWSIHAVVCQWLAELGSKSQFALPTLLRHATRYPRFELNVWAIGQIGGPGVVRTLLHWTYFQGEQHDRKRTDAACAAITSLGKEASNELLALATTSDSDHERTSAILALLHHTAYSPQQVIRLMVDEMDRGSNCQCRDVLQEELLTISQVNHQSALEAIEPRLLGKSSASRQYVRVLSRLGRLAVPALIKSIELEVAVDASVQALAEIGGEGLDYLYDAILTPEQHLVGVCALEAIPNSGARSLDVLIRASGCREDQYFGRRITAIDRLSRFQGDRERIAAVLEVLLQDADATVAALARNAIEARRQGLG